MKRHARLGMDDMLQWVRPRRLGWVKLAIKYSHRVRLAIKYTHRVRLG